MPETYGAGGQTLTYGELFGTQPATYGDFGAAGGAVEVVGGHVTLTIGTAGTATLTIASPDDAVMTIAGAGAATLTIQEHG